VTNAGVTTLPIYYYIGTFTFLSSAFSKSIFSVHVFSTHLLRLIIRKMALAQHILLNMLMMLAKAIVHSKTLALDWANILIGLNGLLLVVSHF
jgi:hypothetical protein